MRRLSLGSGHRVRHFGCREDQSGQTMAIVIGALALLTVIPTAVQLLAVGQLHLSQEAVYEQQALEAARAGLSDYINHVQSSLDYTSFCSSGTSTWSCPSGSTPATFANTANRGFANDPNDSNWAVVRNSSSGTTNESFQYLVDDASYLADNSEPLTVYVTGRAGPASSPVYQTLEARLDVTSDSQFKEGVPSTPTTCGSTTQVSVPAQATWAQITVDGGEGGSSSGGTVGGGGAGAQVVADVPIPQPVAPGTSWTLSPGFAGASGNFQFLTVSPLNGFGQGGPGGCGSMNLSGGNGGGSATLLNALDNTGGGGGAASAICVGTVSACTTDSQSLAVCTSTQTAPCLLAVAGGGGGDGGAGDGLLGGVLTGLRGTGGDGGNSNGNSNGGWSGATGGSFSLLGLGLIPGGSGGTAGGYGGNQSTSSQGSAGAQTVVSGLSTYGGGGGGGFADGGLATYSPSDMPAGGGGAGTQGGLLGLCSLGLCALGTGGGGGAGASDVALEATSSGCPTYSGPTTASYPVLPGNGDNGAVQVTFYNGNACTGSLLPPSVSVSMVQPVTSSSSVI